MLEVPWAEFVERGYGLSSQPQQHRLAAPWSTRDVLLGVALVALLLLAGAVVVELLVRTLVLAGLLVGIAWGLGPGRYRASAASLGFRVPSGWLAVVLPWVALGGSLSFNVLYVTVVRRLGLEALQPPGPPDIPLAGPGMVLAVLAVVLLGPFSEELFFRGFLFGGLVRPLGPVWAAVVSAAVFGGAHLVLGVAIPAAVTGLLLAWLYYQTRSIWACFVAHAAQNALALTALGG